MTKIHRIELLIVDHDNIGADEIAIVLEDMRYPNRCISPRVVRHETLEIEWNDDHPLNSMYDTVWVDECDRLFRKEK